MKKISVVIALLASMSLVSCAAQSPSSKESTNGDLTTVKMGIIPILDVAPIYVGEKQGFFAEQGLALELTQAQGGAAIVPSIISGQLDVGFSNMTSLIVANSKGLPLKVLSSGAGSNGIQGADVGGVVVPKDSLMTSAKDLEGKKVAVNTLGNINDTTVRSSVAKAGGDPFKVDFVEVGFPEMIANVDKGNVDAAQMVEPFLSMATSAGLKVIASNYVDPAENLTTAGYFVSEQFIATHPDIAEKFVTAMKKSLEYSEANPDAVREVLPTYTKIDAGLIDSIILPSYPSTTNKQSVQVLADLAHEHGLIESAFNVDRLLP